MRRLLVGPGFADEGDLLLADDQLGIDADLVGVVVHPAVSVELVEHFRLDLGHSAEVADETVGAVRADGTLGLGQDRDELDIQVHADQLFGRRRQRTRLQQALEGDLDQRVEQLVVQTLEHGAQHQELLLVALCHLGGRHVGRDGLRDHQEQVGVHAFADALADVLYVHQQVVQVDARLEEGLDATTGRGCVGDGVAARQDVDLLALEARGPLQRRAGLVVDALALAQLLVLELLDVTEHFHAGALAVDVLARGVPARGQDAEPLEAALAQELVAVATLLEVARRPGHIAAGLGADVALLAGLDGVDDGDPAVAVAVGDHVLDGRRAVVSAELLHQLACGLLQLAVRRVDVAFVVGGQGVTAHGVGVEVDAPLEVIHDEAVARAESPQLFVQLVQGAVGVGLAEHGLHLAGDLGQPDLDGLIFHQRVVGDAQPEPRSRGAGDARHHARRQDAQRARAGAVVDVVVALLAVVPIRDGEAASTREQLRRQLLPVRYPRRPLGLEHGPSLLVVLLFRGLDHAGEPMLA